MLTLTRKPKLVTEWNSITFGSRYVSANVVFELPIGTTIKEHFQWFSSSAPISAPSVPLYTNFLPSAYDTDLTHRAPCTDLSAFAYDTYLAHESYEFCKHASDQIEVYMSGSGRRRYCLYSWRKVLRVIILPCFGSYVERKVTLMLENH